MITHNPWYMNFILWSAMAGWMIAQSIKLVWIIITEKRLDMTIFVSTGGMPSAHSAFVSGLATSVGLKHGFDGALFAIATVFALIVMFDAQSIRRAAGEQAVVLNRMIKEKRIGVDNLHELLGHTKFQVFTGMLVGIGVGIWFHHAFN
ncbi:divergent PAP2 family protein [bacterium]|nr:divergent PAP2 family protein [bacterium]